jgi:hypothetical protein
MHRHADFFAAIDELTIILRYKHISSRHVNERGKDIPNRYLSRRRSLRKPIRYNAFYATYAAPKTSITAQPNTAALPDRSPTAAPAAFPPNGLLPLDTPVGVGVVPVVVFPEVGIPVAAVVAAGLDAAVLPGPEPTGMPASSQACSNPAIGGETW